MILNDNPKIEIILGDCMDYMSALPNKLFELAIVDPPYGIGDFTKVGDANFYKRKADKKYGKVTWNNETPTKEYFDDLIRISKERIIFGANYYWNFIPEKNFIVWYKDNDSSRWSKCEIASTSIGVNEFVKFTWNGFLRCENVERIHECQKPIKLYRWILQKYAKPGWKIFDSHLGSGSNAIAAYDLGYDFVGIEKDPDNYNAAVKRIKEHLSQTKLFN